MFSNRTDTQLTALLNELCRLSDETEWVEFKHNNDDPVLIGEYISALSNSAALLDKNSAYLVWGVEDKSHQIVGTKFCPSKARHKQQELESWLLQKLNPRINFRFFEFRTSNDLPVAILEIEPARHTPVQFDGVEYIRIGASKVPLKKYSERERELWRAFDRVPFEKMFAAKDCAADEVLRSIKYPSYFELVKIPLPENKESIFEALEADSLISKTDSGRWNITKLGAVLFASDLNNFPALGRKAVRLIQYKGNSRVETHREISDQKGYAIGFEGLIDNIKNLLPANEEIGKAFRKEVPMYPDLAIRELVANALIHQDFTISGTGPMIEIFTNRMEITNPGNSLVDPMRFIDFPPRSRNEMLASFMRRINICEERGSGIDKVVSQVEICQLPAPAFETTQAYTRAILFSKKDLSSMDKEERVRACYLHCCLRFVNREHTNNKSVRERFGIEEQNKASASRIIRETVEANLIKPYDTDAGPRVLRYVPIWA